jgi:hypothetical protein
MSGVFVNYRNGPHSVSVGALADRLVRHFGGDLVFVAHRMVPGTRYPDELRAQVDARDVLIAVIHDGWDEDWRDDKDWVRYEIATALAQGKHVVPVLLENTARLTRERLPDDIAELALRQSVRLRAAHWPEDVETLLSRLDLMVQPAAEERSVPKPKRHWPALGALGWAFPLSVLALTKYHDTDPWWLIYPYMALMSSTALTTAVLATSAARLLNPRFHAVEQRLGKMPYRRYAQRSWIVMAVILVSVAVFLIDFATAGGHWRIWVALVVLLGLAYQWHSLWLKHSEEDTAWPPPVSPSPFLFRRAAVRLHERLTEWKPPRSRSRQQQAVGVYLDLAEARLALCARAKLGWRPWLAAGHHQFAEFFLGWATSVVVLDLIALPAMLRDRASTGIYLVCATILLAALGSAALAIWLELRADRAQTRRHIAELTQWQAKLGPLVFER